jgi:hypothetical protein
MSQQSHEHDDEGNCIPSDNGLYPGGLPTWRFSTWDVVGIALTGVGGVFSVIGQAANLLARECSAMANFERAEFDQRRAEDELAEQQWLMAKDLRALIEGEQS